MTGGGEAVVAPASSATVSVCPLTSLWMVPPAGDGKNAMVSAGVDAAGAV